jgi:hypothetical protein
MLTIIHRYFITDFEAFYKGNPRAAFKNSS